MEKILIVSKTKENAQALSSSLSAMGAEITFEDSFNTSRVIKTLEKNSFDLVIINSQENATSGSELAESLRKKNDTNLILILDCSEAPKFSDNLSKLGVFVLSAPFNSWEICQAVNFINATCSRFDSLKKEKDGLIKKVEDMKIIDRAKCCLIHYLRIPEATAHRHIEKQAMDMRCTKRQVAEEILKKYES